MGSLTSIRRRIVNAVLNDFHPAKKLHKRATRWWLRTWYFRFGNEPGFYREARESIPCEFPECRCPALDGRRYSFTYVREDIKLIYHDVPKCASSSIRHTLFWNQHRYSLSDPLHENTEYTSFTFVRNPWDRMVSNWKMFTTRSGRIEELKRLGFEAGGSFDEFIEFCQHVPNHHWQPQTLFVPDSVDFLGRLERFDEDYATLMEMIGVNSKPPKKRNSSSSAPYWTYYTPSLIQRVGDIYSEDVERFGYDFR